MGVKMEITTQEIIQNLCNQRGISVHALEKILNFGIGSLSKPNVMKSDRLYKVAKYFNVPMEYLMTGEMPEMQDYYIDPEVAELAEELRTRPEMKILFDASRDVTKKDILFVSTLLERLKEEQYGD